MNKFFDRLSSWLDRYDDEKDDDKIPPDEAPPKKTSYIKAWWLLRKIDFKALLPVFISVPVILFFAFSGVLAWIAVIMRFAVTVFNLW